MTMRLVSIAYYALLALFVAWYVRRLDLAALEGMRVGVAWLALATVVALAFRVWGVLVWWEMLRGLGVAPKARAGELAHVYAKAWLGRYVPGKIAWILGKVYFGASLGISRERLAVGALIEAMQQVGITLLLALAILSLDARLAVLSWIQVLALAGVVIAIVAFLHPAVFNALIRWARRLTRSGGDVPATEVRTLTLLRGALLQTVAFVLTGTSYLLLAIAVHPALNASHYLFLVGTFTLAGAIGILAIFAPSGLGVREGVQLLLLPLVMPAEAALVLTIFARLWSVGVDAGFFALAALLRRAQRAPIAP